jgi:hypothetical protein
MSYFYIHFTFLMVTTGVNSFYAFITFIRLVRVILVDVLGIR